MNELCKVTHINPGHLFMINIKIPLFPSGLHIGKSYMESFNHNGTAINRKVIFLFHLNRKGLILGCIIQWKMVELWRYECVRNIIALFHHIGYVESPFICFYWNWFCVWLSIAWNPNQPISISRITYICVTDYSGIKDNLNFQLICNNDLIIV